MSIDERLEDYFFPEDVARNDSNDGNIQYAKQTIYKDLMELIGEDENSMVEEQYASPQPTVDEHYRNQLRQELREKVKKYCE